MKKTTKLSVRAEHLLLATKTGKYPKGTTAQDLYEAKDEDGISALFYAASYGHLPAKTTVKDLSNPEKCYYDSTALHEAACRNKLPPGTTVQDLARVKDIFNNTPLHNAAMHGNCPPETTAQDLASVKNEFGETALHFAAEHGDLLEHTTVQTLAKVKDKKGQTALQLFMARPTKKIKKQMRLLLDATTAKSQQEIKKIAVLFSRKDPVYTAIWSAREMQKLIQKQID